MEYDIIWRKEPQQVWINCLKVAESKVAFEQLSDYTVHIKLNDVVLVAFVPPNFVDKDNKRLSALIVADYGNDVLVDIPAQTLTAGSRLRVLEKDKDSVLGKG